jgi:hypothetical protein
MKRYWLFTILCWLSLTTVVRAVDVPDKFPRLGNYFLDPYISDDEAEELAQWDIVVVGMETRYTSPDAFTIMREQNPDIIILAYVLSEEVPEEHLSETDTNSPIYKLYSKFSEHEDWYLKNSSGDYLSFYPGTRLINVSTSWKKEVAKFMTNQIIKANPGSWDGVYYDNCFNDISWVDDNVDIDGDGDADQWQTVDAQWRSGMNKMMKQTRNRNPNKVILCNSGGEYYTYINGRLIEAFPSEYDGNWKGAMKKYSDVMNEATDPSMVIVNTVANSADATNYQLMRFNLTSTLMDDGFASFDQSIGSHNSLWWYDEYSVSLGVPLGDAYNVDTGAAAGDWSKGVWRRNFENGIVLVNSSDSDERIVLEDGFEKILGTQDTEVNDGTIVGSVRIPAEDGIILQGRIAQVLDDPFVNGTFAKVFSARGRELRNSFFTYNSAYSGSDVVVSVPEIDSVFVAGATYVTVYKSGSQVARFAPYGTSFTGGVNIAVERLEGNGKGYRIVTGTQSGGAQVRIFSNRGQLVNTGCFPYGTSFRGGINVAVADVLPNKPGKEIIVGAGQGGGPQVMVLNKNCKQTGQSWFAYGRTTRTGVWVAAGDVNNDGKDDIVTIPGSGGKPKVKVYTGRGKKQSPAFYAFAKSNTSGAQVAISDIDDDGDNELIAMSFSIFNE